VIPVNRTPGPKTVVIGVGSGMRGDDGFGAAVLAALDDLPRFGGRLRLVGCDGESARLIDLWDGFDHAIVVDAAHDPAARAGRLYRRELALAHWPGLFGADPGPAVEPAGNGHAAGFGTAIRLAEALGRLPDRLTLYAVNGTDFTLGAPLSRRVAAAVPKLATRIRRDLLTQYRLSAAERAGLRARGRAQDQSPIRTVADGPVTRL
jgi:hydrogenase maturation protease